MNHLTDIAITIDKWVNDRWLGGNGLAIGSGKSLGLARSVNSWGFCLGIPTIARMR